MGHSGCNGGKLWRIHVYEKCGPVELKIFDTKVVACEKFGRQSKDCTLGMRPQRAVDLLEEWLFEKETFDYEKHAVFVNSKWFSLSSISRGLHRIGEVFNQPIFFKESEK